MMAVVQKWEKDEAEYLWSLMQKHGDKLAVIVKEFVNSGKYPCRSDRAVTCRYYAQKEWNAPTRGNVKKMPFKRWEAQEVEDLRSLLLEHNTSIDAIKAFLLTHDGRTIEGCKIKATRIMKDDKWQKEKKMLDAKAYIEDFTLRKSGKEDPFYKEDVGEFNIKWREIIFSQMEACI